MKLLAVHLHLYYLSQLPRLLNRLQNLNLAGLKADIFITLPSMPDKQSPAPQYAKAIREIKSAFPDAVIIPTPNRGYDVGPFLTFLHYIDLNKYAYILKIHTKNRSRHRFTCLNHRRMHNALWCDLLQESLIQTPEQIKKSLQLLIENPDTGMVAPSLCLTSEPQYYAHLMSAINSHLAEMNFPAINQLNFVAGTMFLARARLFKPLLRYTIQNFIPTNAAVHDNTNAHVFERLFSAVISAQGYNITGISAPFSLAGPLFLSALQRFLFQKKHTKSGKLIIKICKIPVFSKPLNYE